MITTLTTRHAKDPQGIHPARWFPSAPDRGDRPVAALVHGYNVEALEALQWARGLEERIREAWWPDRDPAPRAVLVSWPSQGQLTEYLDDQAAAEASGVLMAGEVAKILRTPRRQRCDADLCVIAHSMGALLLARACDHAWRALGSPAFAPALSEVLLVAPDLDAEALGPGRSAEAITRMSRRVTVYYSQHDGALRASSIKRLGLTGARLGRHGVEGTVPGNVVPVDCTAHVGGHSEYWASDPWVHDAVATMRGVDRGITWTRRWDGDQARLYDGD